MKELHEYLSKIGKKGGDATKNKHGKEFYKKIGAKGKENRKLKREKLLTKNEEK